MDPTHIFSNNWWYWVWNTYSMSILGFPMLTGFVLKFIAIFHPNVPSDAIIDLMKTAWPTEKPKVDVTP